MANGVMDFNAIGVAFISDDLPPKLQKKADTEMERALEELEAMTQKVKDRFYVRLNAIGLDQYMGIITYREAAEREEGQDDTER